MVPVVERGRVQFIVLALRDYQEAALDGIRREFKAGKRAILLRLPTGGGKTIAAAFMLGSAADKGLQCWFVVHRRELLKQASKAFSMHQIDHGFVAAGTTFQPSKPVQICSIDTLRTRLAKLPPPDLIVLDECHHAVSPTWSGVLGHYPRAKLVGLSATPVRTDGQGLGKWFEAIVHGPEVPDLIRRGALSQFRAFAPSMPDLSGVKVTHGEYVRQQLAHAMGQSAITGNAIEQWKKHANGAKFIAFAVSREHSRAVAAAFRDAGVPCEHVDGDTDPGERDRAMARFRNGELRGLSNVDLYGEGVDIGDMVAAILLRPTCSLGLHLQQVGRALRPAPGKVAVLLDHAGNILRHGLPDEVHDWTLDGVDAAKKKSTPAPTVKVCKKCYAANRAQARECSECGQTFEIKYRTIEEVAGDLEEVDRAKLAKAAAERTWLSRAMGMRPGADRELDYLRDLAQKRGHKPTWAHHVWAAKMAKKEMRA